MQPPKPSPVRRFFNWLYPAHDEIVIYAAAVGLIALAVISGEFRGALSTLTNLVFVEFLRDGFDAGIWKGIWHVFAVIVFTACCLASLLISLRLPFTDRRLDIWVELILIAHILLIFGSNAVAFDQQQDVASWFVLVISFFYLVVFLIGHRFGLLQLRISNRHATARQAFIAAAAITVLVAALSVGFKLHWAHCYALATASAVAIAKIADA